MTVTHIPTRMAEFTHWLNGLAARAEQVGGWWAVFAERDPEGLRACLDGTELLPWDVVESLLRDVEEAPDRGRELYEAAAGAHDRTPGGAEALVARRDAMEGERRHAEARIEALERRLGAHPAPGPEDAARLAHDLAWTRDDHARATARLTDLTARLARLHAPTDQGEAPSGRAAADGPATAAVRRRPRGARYAWTGAADAAEETAPAAVPELPVGGGDPPRGARFRGRTGSRTAAPDASAPEAVAADGTGGVDGAGGADEAGEAARAAVNAVYALRRLRSQGRTGEAHVLLCEALGGPPGRLPALAAELHRAGFGADWGTLLWEAASLPPARLAAVAGALADAGRAEDCEQLLRQGLARPVEELTGAVAALVAEAREREAHALLTAFIRVRTPEEAARLAAVDPALLVPRLGAAARALSAADDRALRHALRVGGVLGL